MNLFKSILALLMLSTLFFCTSNQSGNTARQTTISVIPLPWHKTEVDFTKKGASIRLPNNKEEWKPQTESEANISHHQFNLIPYPQELTPGKGIFTFNESTKIVLSENSDTLSFLAEYLSGMFEKAAGFGLQAEVNGKAGKNTVFLYLDDTFQGGKEAYILDATAKKVTIRASGPAGILYGIQSLRQLLPEEIEKQTKAMVEWRIPAVHIEDKPKFEYRGMQMDVSRHFFSLDYLKRFIDYLVLFKFNRFHIHLTDDQGWRLEIKKYPQLTQEGAWRSMNNHDTVCIENAKTNPDFELPGEFFKMKDGQEVYGGYYTQAQMKDLINYASRRGITIIPEIDMPGHMSAAIKLFPDLSCTDGPGWGQTFSVPLCPCEEGVYEFIENVLSEVVELFPGEYIHIGADEVEKSTWKNPTCEALMKREGLETVEELQSYFVKKVEAYINSKGKKMIGWDEALEGGINPTTTIMYWRGWVPGAPIEAAEGGHDVIMTPTSHCYFDYPPNEESLTHVYSFDPVPDALKGRHEEKIIGVQANLWSEYIPSPARLEYMAMPRMLSLAEVAWTNEKNEGSFLQRIDHFYKRLNVMNINYRVPDIPNLPTHVVFIDTASLHLEKPSIIDEIRYTTDGTLPTKQSALYEGKMAVGQSTDFKVATFVNGRREAVYDLKFEKQTYRAPGPGGNEPGLKVKYYEGEFKSVKEIGKKGFKKSSIEPTVNIPDYAREDQIGLLFEGYVEVPETGIYSFYLASDDGSSLEIGDKLVIDNDGFHGLQDRSGQIALRKGKHPIRIKYFDGGGGNELVFRYHPKGAEEQKIEVKAAMLSH